MTPDLCYLVSSHFSYAAIALPRCLESLRRCGIPPERVFVTVCGCVREFDVKTTLGTFWYVTHESRHYGPFVEAIEPRRREALAPFTHMFFVYDTSEALPEFAALTGTFDPALDAVSAHIYHEGRAQCELGAYRLEYLRSQADYFARYRNITGEQEYDEEGRIFARAPNRAMYGGNAMRVIAGPADVYGTGSMRITEHYMDVGLLKYKSNWGQNGNQLLDRC